MEDDGVFPDVKNAEAAIEFLKQDHDKPFFMVYGLWRPHTPFTAPKRFFDMYDPQDIQVPVPAWRKDDMKDIPPLGRQLAEVWGERYELCGESDLELWRKFVHGYCACTTFADWSAGRVIEALDKSKYAENTIVVFWSDNGYHCGEKNHWEKTTLWEQAALTPLAIRLPDRRNAGSRCGRPVNTLDLYPDAGGLLPPGAAGASSSTGKASGRCWRTRRRRGTGRPSRRTGKGTSPPATSGTATSAIPTARRNYTTIRRTQVSMRTLRMIRR